jgi:hypothetical protein
MAILDATGLDCYLVAATATTSTKAECATAIGTGKRIGKVKSLGNLGGTRTVTEHKFLSNDDSIKSMGSISYGNLTVDMPYDAADAAGQAELRTIYGDKSERKLIIEETDGNYTVVPVKCSGVQKAYALDDFVMMQGTIEINGAYTDITA